MLDTDIDVARKVLGANVLSAFSWSRRPFALVWAVRMPRAGDRQRRLDGGPWRDRSPRLVCREQGNVDPEATSVAALIGAR